MKALWILVIAAAPILAQDPPSAPPVIKLRPLELNFQGVKLPQRRPTSFMPKPAAAQPSTCSIPLLKVVPKGNYPMTVVKPPVTPYMPQVNGPAPSCADVKR